MDIQTQTQEKHYPQYPRNVSKASAEGTDAERGGDSGLPKVPKASKNRNDFER